LQIIEVLDNRLGKLHGKEKDTRNAVLAHSLLTAKLPEPNIGSSTLGLCFLDDMLDRSFMSAPYVLRCPTFSDTTCCAARWASMHAPTGPTCSLWVPAVADTDAYGNKDSYERGWVNITC